MRAALVISIASGALFACAPGFQLRSRLATPVAPPPVAASSVVAVALPVPPSPPVASLAPAPIVTASVAAAPVTSTAALARLEALLEEEEDDGESEEVVTSTGAGPDRRYTDDLSDDELARRWRTEPAALGSISLGFAHEGRLVNAVRFPTGDPAWTVVSPNETWGTAETVEYLAAAIRRVKELHPDAPPLRVNQMSTKDGGWFRPHRSHQNGRDVDLAFYYPTAEVVRAREREKVIDVALNWELVKALVTLTDVQVILVDRRVQKVIFDHALAIGEDRAWVESLFFGKGAILQHARKHRDHFHVRFYSPRAQELARRVAPLLAERPEQNLRFHRVRPGDTLGAIARRYGTSIKAIQSANRLRGSFLRVAQVLKVPSRRACTQCPIPPPVVVPPRRLPPSVGPVASAPEGAGGGAPTTPLARP